MRVRDLNEEMLNEISMKDFKDKSKKAVDGVKKTVGSATKVVKDEYDDNKKAFKIFIRKMKGQEVTPEEFKKALDQMFKDNAKILAIAGLSIAPGASITVPLALKVAKKFGVKLIPEKTFEGLNNQINQ